VTDPGLYTEHHTTPFNSVLRDCNLAHSQR
jgi:hypothetical protein